MLFVAMWVSVARDLYTRIAARSEALGGAAMASIIERVTQSAVDQCPSPSSASPRSFVSMSRPA
jgi:hypothetical protein